MACGDIQNLKSTYDVAKQFTKTTGSYLLSSEEDKSFRNYSKKLFENLAPGAFLQLLSQNLRQPE